MGLVLKMQIKKIFAVIEKLHDNKYRRSGIGLTVAKKIMNALNDTRIAPSEAMFHGIAANTFGTNYVLHKIIFLT